ncbi:MAG: delta-12 fatty acid desaturase [Lentinula lateritia]|uniref:Delta-12 fatty acid desaturase n=1 Tax=Lentinula lateritia TaxID=40482 RepID=A0ABQ8VBQ4_9AGAR|nr:MAG: delta-12 fatty acid desaturase [Lentinula lateritia]KAJ4486508.1 delta-12 fatty acid desaturase [Lentinula lateritia]
MFTSLFYDAPEYIDRKNTPFRPSKVTWNQLHSALPRHIFKKSALKGLSYVVRDVTLAILLYRLAWSLDTIATTLVGSWNASQTHLRMLKWMLWIIYFNVQGILLTSWWCLAHEASHGTLSSFTLVNDLVGFVLHTFLLVPYFSWKSSHLSHHKFTVSVERDENYVPPSRSNFSLPPDTLANAADYREALEETPIYTALRLVAMQVLGLISYLLFNCKGSPRHPPGTNHFNPYSPLFKPHERSGVVISDIGLTIMVCILYQWTNKVGFGQFLRLYFAPYLLTNHWIVMLTYLQHTDPTVPYYRRSQWTFVRGALASVDRPLLGWVGRVFFHNVSHNHISHHLFSSVPFYNQPIATECIRRILKEDYNYDSTNSFRALYRAFTECEFIEDEGDIAFYKNRQGRANRVVAAASIST